MKCRGSKASTHGKPNRAISLRRRSQPFPPRLYEEIEVTPITPRGIEINLNAARPMEAIAVAREMLRSARTASLATLDPSGYPYCTVTNLATDAEGRPYFFMAYLALHARNIELSDRVALTVANMEKDVLTTPRLTLVGRAIRVPKEEFEPLRERYAARFPKAKLYLGLPDALLYRVEIEAVQLNGGPAQNANDVKPADLLGDIVQAA